jgi:hypothetical protein
LPEIDFDHDFDVDTDPERPWFENKIALALQPELVCSRFSHVSAATSL